MTSTDQALAKQELVYKPDWLDSSKIATFHLCPQKYQWRYELHLVPLGGSVINAAAFGTAIHAALATLFNGTSSDMVTCPCPDLEGCGICQGNQIPRYFMEFLIWYPWDPDGENDVRTRTNGLKLLRIYLEKYRQQGFEVVDGSVERTIAIEMGEFTYMLRLDLVTKDRSTGEHMPVDHKTTRFFSDLYTQPYALSIQLAGQAVGTELITGQPVDTAMIDMLRTTSKIDDDSFKRPIITITPETKQRWKSEVEDVWELIKRNREVDFWPRHAPFSCSAYNTLCPYFALCTSGPEQQKLLMETAYKEVVWNPLNLTD